MSLRGLSGAALETQRNACHARGAERLQRLCFANGGVYVKLGQHIAQLVGRRSQLELSSTFVSAGSCVRADCPCAVQDHLMPKAYVEQVLAATVVSLTCALGA